jgi:hypothetical protein
MTTDGLHERRLLANARRRRDRWARRFRPDASIGLLLVAEAPPSDLDRYFYFPTVHTQDALFRYVARSLLGVEPTRANKRELLARLRDERVYLIDLSPEPHLGGSLEPFVPGLVRRVQKIQPERIVLIKTSVYDAAFVALQDADLPVADVRVPFPGSGQQKRFEAAFAEALRWTANPATSPRARRDH